MNNIFKKHISKYFMIVTTLGFMSITACGGSLIDVPDLSGVNIEETTDENGNTTYTISGVTDTNSIQDPNSGETISQIMEADDSSEPLNVFAIDSKGNKLKKKVQSDGRFELDVKSSENYMIGFSLYDGDEEVFVGNINYSIDNNVVDRSPSINKDTDLGRISFSNGHGHCERNPFLDGDHSDFDSDLYAYDDQELRLECRPLEEDGDFDDEFEGEFDDIEDGDDIEDLDDEENEGNQFVQDDADADIEEDGDVEDGDLEEDADEVAEDDLEDADEVAENEDDLDSEDLDGEEELDDEDSEAGELMICEYIEDENIDGDYINWDTNHDIEEDGDRPLWEDFCGGHHGRQVKSCHRMVKLCHDICDLENELDQAEAELDELDAETNRSLDLRVERRSCMRECLF